VAPETNPTYVGGEGAPDARHSEQLNALFVQHLLEDWQTSGRQAIAAAREARPHDYLKLVTSLLAKETDAKADAIEALTDEQLEAELAKLTARLAPASGDPGAGAGQTPADEQAGGV
jgi:hypothetical protein